MPAEDTRPTLTMSKLEHRVAAFANSRADGISRLIIETPERTPVSIRRPYSRAEWVALASDARMEHARANLRAERFDQLTARYAIRRPRAGK